MEGISTKKMMLVLAVMVLICLSITPSSAQTCTMTTQNLNDDCMGVETEAQLQRCCDEINLVLDNDRLCLCLLLFSVYGDHADFKAEVVDRFFTPCGIAGTFDTVCPGVAPSPTEDP
ncbi:hypothetical protein RND81_04G134700 [Saponaria officinalis]|uniref:Bifunctional inhibitor/plant lipid transfer protein/seed storage helical domain-containing protein n=1 Tax=Saponaria officinalis TaxID=3572 RepID=A0AAW1LHB1_SAPOF